MKQDIVIFDTEYTSWKGCQEHGWNASKNQFKEIIQISAVKVNLETLSIVDEMDLIVKITLNKELSTYIQELTGLTQNKMDSDGIDFKNAMNQFNEWIGDCYALSYGRDIDVITDNINLINSDNVFNTNKFKDIRCFFKHYGVPVEQYTSGELYQYFGLDLKGHIHNSLFDCYSLFESFKEITKKHKGSKDYIIIKSNG